MMSFFVFKPMKNIFRRSKLSGVIKFIKSKEKLIINLMAFLVVVFSVGVAWTEADKNRRLREYPEEYNRNMAKNEKVLSDIKTAPSETVAEILERVQAKIKIDLRTEPFVVEIEEVEALKSEQEFFNDSQDGDILVVDSQKALIYRPSTDTLINVGPVYFSDE